MKTEPSTQTSPINEMFLNKFLTIFKLELDEKSSVCFDISIEKKI